MVYGWRGSRVGRQASIRQAGIGRADRWRAMGGRLGRYRGFRRRVWRRWSVRRSIAWRYIWPVLEPAMAAFGATDHAPFGPHSIIGNRIAGRAGRAGNNHNGHLSMSWRSQTRLSAAMPVAKALFHPLFSRLFSRRIGAIGMICNLAFVPFVCLLAVLWRAGRWHCAVACGKAGDEREAGHRNCAIR